MQPERLSKIHKMMVNGQEIDAALRRAVSRALRHKQAGVPISVWRDGRVVQIPPEQIEIPGERAA